MNDLHDDLMIGSKSIAKFVFGSDDKKSVRKLYHLTSEVPPEQRLPIFKFGGQLAARKSTIIEYITERERAGGTAV